MALINCPECKKEISNSAPTCPHCGYSLRAVTIEQSGKTWKLFILMAILMFFVGLALMPNKQLDWLAWMLTTLGVIFFFVGRVGVWWNNR